MPGSATFSSYPLNRAGTAAPLLVYTYDSTQAPGNRLGYQIPNVRCLGIQKYDKNHPSTARFQYIFNDTAFSLYPYQFDQVWPLDAVTPFEVAPDQELVVMTYDANSNRTILFHGFAQIPQADVAPSAQSVTFSAVHVSVRCWDTPIGGRFQRDASAPATGTVYPTAIPTRFNPAFTVGRNGVSVQDWQPNCTPDGFDVNQGQGNAYPVFLDELLPEAGSGPIQTYWTIGKFVRYVLANYNDQKWVQNLDFTSIDAILNSFTPSNGQFYNPNDPTTYSANPMFVRDFDATNMKWPDALETQLNYAGFGMRFETQTDGNGEASEFVRIYRLDAFLATSPKSVMLPVSGTPLDPGTANMQHLHVVRDMSAIANRIDLEAALDLYEVSVILAPAFQPVNTDATSRNSFKLSVLNPADPVARNKYRTYIADETGYGVLNNSSQGHWNLAGNAWSVLPFNFRQVFDPDDPTKDPNRPLTYARRHRPGRRTLISQDPSGKPLPARLDLSRDYAGATNAICDGTGTWQPITGGWELLKDRLGIYINIEDVEQWTIGEVTGGSAQNSGAVLRGITSIAAPTANVAATRNTALFYLRLTTVIEADTALTALADRRAASPTKYPITQRIDAKDHCHRLTIAGNTAYNTVNIPLIGNPTTGDNASLGGQHLDDTPRAKAQTQAVRAAHEFPPLAGTITIPWLSLAYQVGDRINRIQGRNVTMQTNVGVGQGEAPMYPFVVSIIHDFEGEKQTTTLQLSDRRAEPQRA